MAWTLELECWDDGNGYSYTTTAPGNYQVAPPRADEARLFPTLLQNRT